MDRLSNLPDVVFQEILSILSMEDIARNSLVSKTFRRLCLCVPDLYIRPLNQSNQRQLCDWIPNFLLLRNGAKIRRFHVLPLPLRFNQIKDFPFHVQRWIHNAVLCNIEEFDLSLNKSDIISLPLSIFACASLKVLKLNLEFGVLKLFSSTNSAASYSFTCLQVLSIRRVKFIEELSEDWISSLFPSLKELNLDDLMGLKNLKITSSSLECLSITYPGVVEISVFGGERLKKLSVNWCKALPTKQSSGIDSYVRLFFRLSAPNLEEFIWRGQLYANYCFQGSFMCLQSAIIADVTNHIVVPIDYKCYLFQLLRFVSQAKSLKLVGWVLEELYKLDSLPDMSGNVQNLEIQAYVKTNHKIPSLMASLVESLPTLKTLKWDCIGVYFNSQTFEGHDFEGEYW